jgi:hypothetical protein
MYTHIYITSALLFFSSSYMSSILLGRLGDPDPSHRTQLEFLHSHDHPMAKFESSAGASDWFKMIIVLKKNLSEYLQLPILIGEMRFSHYRYL